MSENFREAGSVWTVETVQELRDMAAENIPPHIISMKLGQSLQRIYEKLTELGIRYRPD